MPMFRIEWVEHRYGEVWASDITEAERVAVIPDIKTEASLRYVSRVDPLAERRALDAIVESRFGWTVHHSEGKKDNE